MRNALTTSLLRVISLYVRHSPIAAGRWRLLPWTLAKVRAHGALMKSAVIRTRYGFRMHLHLDDWVDQHIFVAGVYEDMTAHAVAALLTPGDRCVDAGANIGFFSLLMARAVGPAGIVWAFEPNPRTRARLLTNLNLNAATNVVVRDEALADQEGAREFDLGPPHHSGAGTLRHVQEPGERIAVAVSRLPSCLPQDCGPRLIKIDVEGSEYQVLSGMTEILTQHHPDLVVEVSADFLAEMGASAAELCARLQGMGYRMFVIGWDSLRPCASWNDALPAQFNALFTTRQTLPDSIPVRDAFE